jgi:hypothetical protein
LTDTPVVESYRVAVKSVTQAREGGDVSESFDGRRPHDPNDERGGGGPGGGPDKWTTTRYSPGELRREQDSQAAEHQPAPQEAAPEAAGPAEPDAAMPAGTDPAPPEQENQPVH